MLISHKHRFIYIHVYKTAGTSIRNALLPFCAPKWRRGVNRILRALHIPHAEPAPCHVHARAWQIAEAMGRERFDAYYSFGFVRNPWGWQVSLYNYMLKNTQHYQHEFIKSLGSFDAFIRWRCSEKVPLQKDWLYGPNDECLVDFVGRFEHLNADFQTICQQVGIEAELPRLNVSNTRPYQDFYDEETRDMVADHFAEDIERFGYAFAPEASS